MSIIGAVAGPAIAGGLGLIGQRNANRSNVEEATRNRDWQERMSNTSYQRAMSDMRAAGLNPMLAFMKGGASTPSGAQAANAQNELGTMATSAMDMRRMSAEYDKIRQDTRLSEAQAMASKAQGLKTAREAEILGLAMPKEELKNAAYQFANEYLKGNVGVKLTHERSPDKPGDKFTLGGLVRIRKKGDK
jgi:hypothetical protein